MPDKERRDFDKVAAQWDEEPRRVQLARDVVEAIRREIPVSHEMDVLDYGCGSGLVTLGLQPLVKRITGADSSRGMLDVLQKKVQERGLPNVDTTLLDLEKSLRLDGSYDLIVSSMTLHHVDEVPSLIRSLTQGLKRGGWLALADLEKEDGSFHDDATGVLHHGFESDFLYGEFTRSGLIDVRVTRAATMEKQRGAETRDYHVLLCVGRKPV